MPGTLSIITNAFPPEERGKAIGTWAGVSALALAIGPVVGGALTEYASWRAIFFLNLPVAAGAVAVTLFAVHESRDETVERTVDVPGIAALSLGLTALVLALVEGNSWGWGSARIVGLLVAAAIGLLAFALLEPRVRVPMVDFSFFRSRTFLGTNLIAFILTFAMFATFFFIALYLQNILGYSPVEAGVRFLPATLMVIVTAPIAGRLADRIGPRPLIVGGLMLVALSLLLQTRIGIGTTYDRILPAFVILGVGDSPDDLAHVDGGHELRQRGQGGRRIGDSLDEPNGRRELRRGRPRRLVPAPRLRPPGAHAGRHRGHGGAA